jgi:NAD(P)H-hydrate epimerase
MKLLSAKQIREADAYTIKHEPVSSIDLMERAALACFGWLEQQYGKDFEFTVCCGPGNNGGDGLAIARLLHEAGYKVEVNLLEITKKTSKDYDTNLKRLKKEGEVVCTSIMEATSFDLSGMKPNEVIIDAIFGYGLSRQIEGFLGEIINEINISSTQVVSIDIPSGLFSEDNTENKGIIIKADYTLSLQLPKLAFMFPDNGVYTVNG